MSRKFGWHSGTLNCQDAKVKGDLYVQEDIIFSDVSAGALAVTGGISSVYNISTQLGQYVQGIKIEHTRNADIQPSTGGWWGAQIVLNAGTGYSALNKTAYVLHCVFKGDATDPSNYCVNVGRFETQSDGKVEDLLFVSANSGSTVTGDVGRFVAHVAPTRSILALQNGTVGSTPAGLFIDVDETMTNAIEINSGAAITKGFTISGASVVTTGIDLADVCTTAIDIGTCTTGISFTGTTTRCMSFATAAGAANSGTKGSTAGGYITVYVDGATRYINCVTGA